MRDENCINEDGLVLTDSCFWMSWKICEELVNIPIFKEEIDQELCCYGDFMRPMGSNPNIAYIETSNSRLSEYRKCLADLFSQVKIEIVNLGPNSFYHFGTYSEFLDHISPNSTFRQRFPYSDENGKVVVEFSTLNRAQNIQNSVVSGILINSNTILPNNCVIFTLALPNKKFVTIMMGIRDDVKMIQDQVKLNGHDTGIRNSSLWAAKLFTANFWKYGLMDELVSGVYKTHN
ncbi:unnamed protein product [Caenorhabditis bovis]|uniref:GDP-fucose pyrophosphorylase domain-containing protein n=1 Tax=Caenorhabditis bovis TaxID=2654633 RepID=A0A8S1ERQ5_9PELO|nr:unnamed protein product [Caenorhabditis bovis]